jgi:hypothetical protein
MIAKTGSGLNLVLVTTDIVVSLVRAGPGGAVVAWLTRDHQAMRDRAQALAMSNYCAMFGPVRGAEHRAIFSSR